MLELVKVRIQSVHLGSRVRVCTHKSADGQSSCLSLIRFLTQQFKNSPPTPLLLCGTHFTFQCQKREYCHQAGRARSMGES